jgi:hypothetical protein
MVTERLEHVHEQGVLLEAVAAAPQRDQFVFHDGGVEHDRATEQHIEVFERDVAHVREDERVQVGETGRVRPAVLDAFEVPVKVGSEGHGRHL